MSDETKKFDEAARSLYATAPDGFEAFRDSAAYWAAAVEVPLHARIADLERQLAERNARYDAQKEAFAEILAELSKRDAEIERLRQGKAKLDEASEILNDLLESDDFQSQYSQRQHMTGPALRGGIERALGAIDAAREAGDE